MNEFEKWSKRNWKDYSFKRWQKDFGQRLVGKRDRGSWHKDNIVLIYHFTERKPTIEDFAGFLKDFERFYDQYHDYERDGAYFVVYEEYEKKAFNILLKKMDNDLRNLVQVKTLQEKIFVSRAGIVVQDCIMSKEFPQSSEQKTTIEEKAVSVHRNDKAPAGELLKAVHQIINNLRKAIRQKPRKEGEVNDALETLLIGAGLEKDFLREKVHIPYSSKTYIPDFVFKQISTTVETKFCDRTGREKEIIAEINDNILAYKTTYSNLIFIIYDTGGVIRNVDEFKDSIEKQESVLVKVIKH